MGWVLKSDRIRGVKGWAEHEQQPGLESSWAENQKPFQNFSGLASLSILFWLLASIFSGSIFSHNL